MSRLIQGLFRYVTPGRYILLLNAQGKKKRKKKPPKPRQQSNINNKSSAASDVADNNISGAC